MPCFEKTVLSPPPPPLAYHPSLETISVKLYLNSIPVRLPTSRNGHNSKRALSPRPNELFQFLPLEPFGWWTAFALLDFQSTPRQSRSHRRRRWRSLDVHRLPWPRHHPGKNTALTRRRGGTKWYSETLSLLTWSWQTCRNVYILLESAAV